MTKSVSQETFLLPRRVFQDEKTGREVWQLTDGEFECVAPYMDVRAWTNDDRHLIFTSNRTGSWQPHVLNVETGEAWQLAQTEGSFRSIALDPMHGEVYCQDGDTVIAVNLETRDARLAIDLRNREEELGTFGGGKGRTPVLNADGSLIAATAVREDGQGIIIVTATDGSNEIQIVPVGNGILPGHILFCPGDDNIISTHAYPDRQNRMEEPPEIRTAQWRIERDSGAMKPLVLVPPGYRATHCTWGPSGDRFYLHRKSVPDWTPTALCSVNREGEDMRVHYETNQWKLGHSAASPDESWIVTDSQDTDENILMIVRADGSEQRMLCWPNMAQKTSTRAHKRNPELPPHTDVDTHPGFSSTGRYIHYTSDVSGRSQIYVVPVDECRVD